jgi:hypothetical protein
MGSTSIHPHGWEGGEQGYVCMRAGLGGRAGAGAWAEGAGEGEGRGRGQDQMGKAGFQLEAPLGGRLF